MGDVLVDAATLRARVEAGEPGLVLLDVRWKLGDPEGRRWYGEGHIPGAVYVDMEADLAAPAATPVDARGRHPLPELAALQASARSWGVRADSAVVVYDDAGGMAAARAWWLLRWAGLGDVRLLDGGLGAWRAAGGALETGSGAGGVASVGDVTFSGAGRLPVLDADAAAALAVEPGGVLLDARARERYRGETEPVDPRAGHIPGALSAPTAENLNANGTFRPADELRARFTALGVGDGVTVGASCGSGINAAHELAALAIAGFSGALYEGSWSGWVSDPERPVATGPEA